MQRWVKEIFRGRDREESAIKMEGKGSEMESQTLQTFRKGLSVGGSERGWGVGMERDQE